MERKTFQIVLVLCSVTVGQCLTFCEPHADTFSYVQGELQAATSSLKIGYSEKKRDAFNVFNAILQKLEPNLSENSAYNRQMSNYVNKKAAEYGVEQTLGASDVEKLQKAFQIMDDDHNGTKTALDAQRAQYSTLSAEAFELQETMQRLDEISRSLGETLRKTNATYVEAELLNAKLNQTANEKRQARLPANLIDLRAGDSAVSP